MSWQKCPACDGSGMGEAMIGIAANPPPVKLCSVCAGRKIISTLTGEPPKKKQMKGMDTEPPTAKEVEDFFKQMSPFDDMSEDEIQYWATPFYDQIQERKRLKQEAINNNTAYEPPPEGRVRM